MRENVASFSNVIIKGDRNPKGNMWKIKGCRGGVGVVIEDVLMAWSVGPVPTKHLISLIKRTLAWYILNSGESGHVPSLYSPPLSPTHIQAPPSATKNTSKREKVTFCTNSQNAVLSDPAKTRLGKLVLKHSRGSLWEMYRQSLTRASAVCPLLLKRAFRFSSTKYPEC